MQSEYTMDSLEQYKTVTSLHKGRQKFLFQRLEREITTRLKEWAISDRGVVLRATPEECEPTGDCVCSVDIMSPDDKIKIHMRIPAMTEQGLFHIGRKQWAPVARLLQSPGFFRREHDGQRYCELRPAKGPTIRWCYCPTNRVLIVSLARDAVVPAEVVLDGCNQLVRSTSAQGQCVDCQEKDCLARDTTSAVPFVKACGMDDDDDIGAALQSIELDKACHWQIERRLKRLVGDYVAPDFLTPELFTNLTKYANLWLDKSIDLPTNPDELDDLSNQIVWLIDDVIIAHLKRTVFRVVGKKLEHERKQRNDEEKKRAREQKLRDDELALINKTIQDMLPLEIRRCITDPRNSILLSGTNPLIHIGAMRRISKRRTDVEPLRQDEDERSLHWSHYGRICPIDTPHQGLGIGLMLSVLPECRVADNGQLECPARDQKGELVWITSAEESPDPFICESSAWIASRLDVEGHEAIAMQRGKREKRKLEEINFVLEHQDSVGSVGRVIPFLHHSEPARTSAACNMLRQAVSLVSREMPLVATPQYKQYGALAGDAWTADSIFAPGVNLRTVFVSWKGLNFEDGIVLSESAARKLTSIHEAEIVVPIMHKMDARANARGHRGHAFVSTDTTPEPPGWLPDQLKNLDADGVIKVGSTVNAGDILVGFERTLEHKQSHVRSYVSAFLEGRQSVTDASVRCPSYVQNGSIKSVCICKSFDPSVEREIVIKIAYQRPFHVGDKLANRHGMKGVVTAILPEDQMPYYSTSVSHDSADGESNVKVEMILNPLSVLSRMNPGQLFEAAASWVTWITSRCEAADPFVPLDVCSSDRCDWQDLAARLGNLGLPKDGKVELFDPATKLPLHNRVVAGFQYVVKLHHYAADKLSYRSGAVTEDYGFGSAGMTMYSTRTQQPVRKLRHYDGTVYPGGQRIGEMESWALQAYGAWDTLLEMFTLRSDSPRRHTLRQHMISSDVTGWQAFQDSACPTSMLTLSGYLAGLGLDLRYRHHGMELGLLPLPESVECNASDISLVPFRKSSVEESLHYYVQAACRQREPGRADASSDTSPKKRSALIDEVDTRHSLLPRGIFSQQVFGPIDSWLCQCENVKIWDEVSASSLSRCPHCEVPIESSDVRRRRIGFIKLAVPMPNPLALVEIMRLTSLTAVELDSMMRNRSQVSSGEMPKTIRGLSVSSESERTPRLIRKWLPEILICCSPSFRRAVISLMSVELADQEVDRPRVSFKRKLELLENDMSKNPLSDRAYLIPSAVDSFACLLAQNERELLHSNHYPPVRPVADDKPSERRLKRTKGKPTSLLNQAINLASGSKVLSEWFLPLQQMEGIMMEYLPVIPPALRPVTKTQDGRVVLGDLNTLYNKVIAANAAVSRSTENPAKAAGGLWRAIRCLFENGKLPDPEKDRHGRSYQSLLDLFAGNTGVFREELLGKRLDYSARCVVVAADTHRDLRTLDECLVPRKVLWNLFQPLILGQVIADPDAGLADEAEAIAVIEDMLGGNEVGAEIFDAVNKAIEIVCRDNRVIVNRQPTLHRLGMQAFRPIICKDEDAAVVKFHPLLTAAFAMDFDGDTVALYPVNAHDASRMAPSTNLLSPSDGCAAVHTKLDIALGSCLAYMNWNSSRHSGEIETIRHVLSNQPVDNAKELKQRIDRFVIEGLHDRNDLCAKLHAFARSAFDLATLSGVSPGVLDTQPDRQLNDESWCTALVGMDPWLDWVLLWRTSAAGGTEKIRNILWGRPSPNSEPKIPSLIAGLTASDLHRISEECRKNLSVKALSPGTAGSLTRSLVYSAHDLAICKDCGTTSGVSFPLTRKDMLGRCLAVGVGQYPRGHLIASEREADDIIQALSESGKVILRSPITCEAKTGICDRCYGWDLSRRELAEQDLAVGIIAAQSIGEPGLQLTMKQQSVESEGHDIGSDLQRARRGFSGAGQIPADPSCLTENDRESLLGPFEIYSKAGVNIKHLEVITRARKKADSRLTAIPAISDDSWLVRAAYGQVKEALSGVFTGAITTLNDCALERLILSLRTSERRSSC